MRFTYRYIRRGVTHEHHADTLEELTNRAMADMDQHRADPVEIRDGRKVLLGITEINDLWEERAEESFWAV